MMCQNWHVACVHEGSSDHVQQPLYDAIASASEPSDDRSMTINAGGGGDESVEPTYSDKNRCGNWLPKLGRIGDPLPLFDSEAIINKELDIRLERANEWIYQEIGGEGIDPKIHERELKSIKDK